MTIFLNILQQCIVLKRETQMEAVLFFVSVIFFRRKSCTVRVIWI